MRICPNCDGSQMLVVEAKTSDPPSRAFAYMSRLGEVSFWIVDCPYCKFGFVGPEDPPDESTSYSAFGSRSHRANQRMA